VRENSPVLKACGRAAPLPLCLHLRYEPLLAALPCEGEELSGVR
jgi:hypothetical protein